MRRNVSLLMLLTLDGCSSLSGLVGRHPPPPATNVVTRITDDRDTTAALLIASTLQTLRRLQQAAPAEQAEILSTARDAYQRSPLGGAQLRYALVLAMPGHPARDPVHARILLRELAASPEALQPAQRALALVELAQLDRELELTTTNAELQNAASHTDHDQLAAVQRRLLAQQEESARLRKQLAESQAKLDAIANIERNITERKSGNEGRKP